MGLAQILGQSCRCATLLTRSTRQHRPSTCPLSHQRHRRVDALGGQCSGALGVLELCGGPCCLSCRCAGSAVGLAMLCQQVESSQKCISGWARRAAVREYVTAYTFLCTPCLRCTVSESRFRFSCRSRRRGRAEGARAPSKATQYTTSVTHGAPHDSALTVAQRTIWAMMHRPTLTRAFS